MVSELVNKHKRYLAKKYLSWKKKKIGKLLASKLIIAICMAS